MVSMENAAMLTAATLLSAGCASVPDLSPDEMALISRDWFLVGIGSAPEEIRLRSAMSERHAINFDQDHQISLQLDCNRGTATWSISRGASGSGRLMIGPIAATRALCPTPSYGERMAAELPQATGYDLIDGGRSLTILTPADIYTFEAR